MTTLKQEQRAQDDHEGNAVDFPFAEDRQKAEGRRYRARRFTLRAFRFGKIHGRVNNPCVYPSANLPSAFCSNLSAEFQCRCCPGSARGKE